MKDEVLVKVEGVSKKFCKDLKTSLWYGMKDLGSEFLGVNSKKELRKKEFWSVKDISFELRRGECLGLIGHNGAGKSTLLKMLNGLIKPDKGKITIYGRVGALIELGAGFNPLLTGRENVYVNGQILGFSKREIDQKLDAILEFAELEDFIDSPVQNYSSGMKVRLGFAVAAQMEPDVLIIDEVLAVGDIGFRMKCLSKIGGLLSNSAVIFVSHTMPQIARVSNKILLMHKGKPLFYDSNTSLGVEKYYQLFNNSDRIVGGNGKIEIVDFKILNEKCRILNKENDNYILRYKNRYYFYLELDVKPEANNFWVNFSFIDKDTKQVANLFSLFSDKIFSGKGLTKIEVELDRLLLGQGLYTIGVALNEVRQDGSRGEIYLYNSNVSSIRVTGIPAGLAPVQFSGEWKQSEQI